MRGDATTALVNCISSPDCSRTPCDSARWSAQRRLHCCKLQNLQIRDKLTAQMDNEACDKHVVNVQKTLEILSLAPQSLRRDIFRKPVQVLHRPLLWAHFHPLQLPQEHMDWNPRAF